MYVCIYVYMYVCVCMYVCVIPGCSKREPNSSGFDAEKSNTAFGVILEAFDQIIALNRRHSTIDMNETVLISAEQFNKMFFDAINDLMVMGEYTGDGDGDGDGPTGIFHRKIRGRSK